LRDGAVDVRVAVRAVTPRDAFARDGVTESDVTRDTDVVAVLFARGLGRPERVALPARIARGDIVSIFAGAIGSANAARIDINVEQVKNAPPNKNTVPMAFLQQSEKLRLFIFTLPRIWISQNSVPYMRFYRAKRTYICYYYNIFPPACKY
jgi:hypothetical protein